MTPRMDGARIDALRRILAKCESPEILAPAPRARAVADEMNHLFGARRHEEFAGHNDAGDVLVSPDLIACLIRIGRGERIAIGRLLFNPDGPRPAFLPAYDPNDLASTVDGRRR